MTDWLEAMNPAQRAAAWELATTGRMTPELLAALQASDNTVLETDEAAQ